MNSSNIIVYKLVVFVMLSAIHIVIFMFVCLLLSGCYIYCRCHLKFLSTNSVSVGSDKLSSHKVVKFKVVSFPHYLLFCKEMKCLFSVDGEGPVHYGVCSNYLRDANEGDDIHLFVRR